MDIAAPSEKFASTSSRYHRDYIELESLGEGGFAHVFKCTNLVDDQMYAVKKIFFNYDIGNKLREAHILCSMEHDRIVRHIDSWIEVGFVDKEDDKSKKEDDDSKKKHKSGSDDDFGGSSP
ncbi:probable serine/threonine-protein kinase DDB_G0283065 [Tripterygium wilfordii]|uniref:probable serine/threonine-protein kinase DDB_G0283065 n=1 Tax=Tripterygium wilfordii TaxID=458696 RepID=UPI0018F83EA9|nr:probable serine/threonine-protein kinase DDB_G0283065 [Tripterygium wilfordii]